MFFIFLFGLCSAAPQVEINVDLGDALESLDRGFNTDCPFDEGMIMAYVKANICLPPTSGNTQATVTAGGVTCWSGACADANPEAYGGSSGSNGDSDPEPAPQPPASDNSGSDSETPLDDGSVPSNADYCAANSKHTMCIYPNEAAKTCGSGVIVSGLSDAGRRALLDRHNELRNKAAQGADQPAAANLRKLTWNNELESIAQRWVEQCTFGHDKQRNLLDGTYVGQNAYSSSSSVQSSEAAVNSGAGGAVDAWYNEINNPGFSNSDISPFVFSYGAGHYTQVVWAETTQVGCGLVTYKDGSWFKELIVCNYAKGGNMGGAEMYKQGAGASQCPAGTSQDSQYTGLCS